MIFAGRSGVTESLSTPPTSRGARPPAVRAWARVLTHPWAVSAAVHAALFALLWSGMGPIGVRGPGASATSDGSRDEASAATWEFPDAPPPSESDELVFEAAASEAVPPPEALDPSRLVDEPPPADAVPVEADVPADFDAPPADVETREALVPFGPGRPIPRTLAKRTPTPPSPVPTSTTRVATVATAPTAPARPPAAARAGGGYGLRPPVPDPSNRQPVFPAEAYARGERGRVTLLLRLSAEGSVTDVTVSESSGSASLDRAALDAARGWRFRPATRDDGTAIASTVRRGVNFD